MLYEFVQTYREAIIAKTRSRSALGRGRRHPRPSSKTGCPIFLDQLSERLPFRRRLNQSRQISWPIRHRTASNWTWDESFESAGHRSANRKEFAGSVE